MGSCFLIITELECVSVGRLFKIISSSPPSVLTPSWGPLHVELGGVLARAVRAPLRSPTCGLPAPPGARPVGGSRCATAPRCARRERGSTLPRVHKELGIQVHTGWSLPTSFTFSCLHPLFPCPLNFLRTHWSDSRDLFFNSHPYVES